MPKHLNERMLLAFREELVKTALPSFAQFQSSPRLRNAASMAGLGTAGGAAIGGLYDGVQDYRQNKEQGASTGQALLGSMGGALRGAGKGALIGTGIGALGGSAVSKDLSGTLNAFAPARAAQRQVHSLVGHLSPEEYRAVRGGDWDAKKTLDELTARKEKLQGLLRPGAALKDLEEGNKLESALPKAQAAYDAQHKAHDMGLSSLPGYYKAVKEHGIGALGAAGKTQFAGQGMGSLALGVGLPAYGLYDNLSNPDDTRRGERLGEELGMVAGGVLGSPLPVVGQVATSTALSGVGKYIGKGVDAIRARNKPVYQPSYYPNSFDGGGGQAIPTERVISDRAQGIVPEAGS